MNSANCRYIPFKINDLIIIKKIVTIHYQEIDFNYKSKTEKHNFWEIIYVDKNEIDVTINNDKYHLKQKHIIFIKPNDIHSLTCNTDTNIFIISFEVTQPAMNYFTNKQLSLGQDEIKLLSLIINEGKKTFEIPKFDPDLTQLKLLDNPIVGGQQLIKNYLEIFIVNLLRLETKKENPEIFFYSKNDATLNESIIRYLKNNIYNKLRLEDISKELHFSKSYICNEFKRINNISIISYYLNLKIDEAKILIQKGISNKTISQKLLFNDTAHFLNSFKRITGYTTKEYKESIL